MKALFRNLMVCAAMMAFAGQARAAGADVVWTFSGFQFNQLFDFGTFDPVGSDSGVIKAGSTMTFDGSGNLLSFNIVTSGGAFGFTYSSLSGTGVTAPADNTNVPGAWEFANGDSILELTFAGGGTMDPSMFPSGWGPIMPLTIDQNNTFEVAFTSDITNTYPNGLARIGSADGSQVTATRVPEPASMAVLGVGLLGLGVVARRRGRSA